MDRKSGLHAHAARNAQLLRVLEAKQVDLSEAHSIEFHFWAWNQPDAVQFAYELYKRGFMLLMLNAAFLEGEPERWNIEAGKRMAVSAVIESEFVESLVDFASSFNAEYDGWGTSV